VNEIFYSPAGTTHETPGRYCELMGIPEVRDLEVGMDFRKPEYKATLLQGGIDPDIVACFDSMSGYARTLNNGPNPVKAARTMSDRPKFGPILADFKKRQAKAKPSSGDSATAPDLKCSSCGELLNSKDVNTVHVLGEVFTHRQDGELCVVLGYEDILGPDGKIVNTCKGCGTGDVRPCCKQCPNYVEPPAMPDVDEL
jgi:hypothetical protein